jgi:hypothetical protein
MSHIRAIMSYFVSTSSFACCLVPNVEDIANAKTKPAPNVNDGHERGKLQLELSCTLMPLEMASLQRRTIVNAKFNVNGNAMNDVDVGNIANTNAVIANHSAKFDAHAKN